jgi:hypothetical protein
MCAGWRRHGMADAKSKRVPMATTAPWPQLRGAVQTSVSTDHWWSIAVAVHNMHAPRHRLCEGMLAPGAQRPQSSTWQQHVECCSTSAQRTRFSTAALVLAHGANDLCWNPQVLRC